MAHFYGKDAKLYDSIANKSKPGEFRDFTLADARKHYQKTGEILYSSVSTELQILSKPELNLWFNEQAVKQSLAEPWDGIEEQATYIRRTALRAGDQGKRAADYGTEIHGFICEYLGGPTYSRHDFISSKHIAERVCEWLKREGYVVLHPERTVVSEELGVAGTIDLQCEWREKNILGDFKTTTPPLAYRKEHGYQLAGYDAILGGWADERHIFYINRESIGDIKREVCVEPSRDDAVWNYVHQLWSTVNRWPPEKK